MYPRSVIMVYTMLRYAALCYTTLHNAFAIVAQLVEQRIRNAWVAGSSPASGSNIDYQYVMIRTWTKWFESLFFFNQQIINKLNIVHSKTTPKSSSKTIP